LLAREVDLERMRRAQPKTSGKEPVASSSKQRQQKPHKPTTTEAVDKNLPNFLQKLQPKKIAPEKVQEKVSTHYTNQIGDDRGYSEKKS
jgi:hypothetical protein